MRKQVEKTMTKYVIATLDFPTSYVRSLGWGKYVFTDNIEYATKTINRKYAEEICSDCNYCDNLHDFVVVPVEITFSLIDES